MYVVASFTYLFIYHALIYEGHLRYLSVLLRCLPVHCNGMCQCFNETPAYKTAALRCNVSYTIMEFCACSIAWNAFYCCYKHLVDSAEAVHFENYVLVTADLWSLKIMWQYFAVQCLLIADTALLCLQVPGLAHLCFWQSNIRVR